MCIYFNIYIYIYSFICHMTVCNMYIDYMCDLPGHDTVSSTIRDLAAILNRRELSYEKCSDPFPYVKDQRQETPSDKVVVITGSLVVFNVENTEFMQSLRKLVHRGQLELSLNIKLFRCSNRRKLYCIIFPSQYNSNDDSVHGNQWAAVSATIHS